MFYILLACMFITLAISPWVMARLSERATLAKRRDQALTLARSGNGRPLSYDDFFAYYQNAFLMAWWNAERVVRVSRDGTVVHRQLTADVYGFLRDTRPNGGVIDLNAQLASLKARKKDASFQKARAAADPVSAGRTELVGRRREKTALN